MPACESADGRMRRMRPPVLFATLLALTFSGAIAANFKVNQVLPRISGQALVLGGSLDLTLTPKVEEALATGIPLDFVVEVRLERRRALIWDETLEDWSLRRQLRYHALSGQYLVSGEPSLAQNRESFDSLTEALSQAGSLDEVHLPIETQLPPDADYRVNVRVVLDVEALPPLLRPVAYTSRAWDLNSGWTTWKVQP